MKTTASILDFPKSGLDTMVWDASLNLYPEHKKQILSKLDKYLTVFELKHSKKWIKRIKIIGSLCSWQWRNDSDLDVHIEVDVKAFSKKEFNDKVSTEYIETLLNEIGRKYLNGDFKEKLGKTEHDLEFFFEFYSDDKLHETQSVIEYDGVYNLLTNKWDKPPRIVTSIFNPEQIFAQVIDTANQIAQRCDIQIGNIRRDVIDINFINEALSTFKDEQTIQAYKKEIDTKLIEIENEIKEYLKTTRKVIDARKKAKSQYDDENLIMKFLSKYSYIFLTKQLEQFMAQTPKLTEKNITRLLKILEKHEK